MGPTTTSTSTSNRDRVSDGKVFQIYIRYMHVCVFIFYLFFLLLCVCVRTSEYFVLKEWIEKIIRNNNNTTTTTTTTIIITTKKSHSTTIRMNLSCHSIAQWTFYNSNNFYCTLVTRHQTFFFQCEKKKVYTYIFSFLFKCSTSPKWVVVFSLGSCFQFLTACRAKSLLEYAWVCMCVIRLCSKSNERQKKAARSNWRHIDFSCC